MLEGETDIPGPIIVGSIGRKDIPEKEPTASSGITGSIGREGKKRIIGSTKKSEPVTPLSSFEVLQPKPKKTTLVEIPGVEIRQASTKHHQDGIAYNTDTQTYVVCDGMGGVGSDTQTKDNFAFALAQAVSEQSDISAIAQMDQAIAIIDRAKKFLAILGVDFQKDLKLNLDSRVISSLTRDKIVGSTIAAVQRIDGTNTWRVVTLGDSSVIVIAANGKIKEGYGEAWQLISQGNTNSDGSAPDSPLCSYIGINREGNLAIRYSSRGLTAEFSEFEALTGDKIVIVSDAYLQKSSPETLINDMNKTAEQWAAGANKDKDGMYGDDASMIIIDPSRV
ncbi:MAG: hypothetical protein WEC80_02670 [Patescibacteria group bacterium]